MSGLVKGDAGSAETDAVAPSVIKVRQTAVEAWDECNFIIISWVSIVLFQ